ncbi:hypothetical protein [Streptomyces sp. NPDC001903]|uniref:hypothetical protein n=1 Tax=Streptomyces sp. NPDC001903 TaxID=3364622 RepID=UPI0036CFC627
MAAAASGEGTRGATGRARRCTAGVRGDRVSEVDAPGACLTGVTPTPARRGAGAGRAARCAGRPSEAPSPWFPYDTTGRVSEGSSSPEPGRAAGLSIPLTSPPGAPASTAWDMVPPKQGFCHVLRRRPNPASATGPAAPAVTRWIGGSADQPAADQPPADPDADPEAGRTAPASGSVAASA